MATNNLPEGTENNETSTTVALDDVQDDDITGLDDESVLAESKKLSMFCRNCLAPYQGEKGQAGSIILKCEKCHHTDVVLEDDLDDNEQSESLEKGGNLMLNRFSKVFEKNELVDIDIDDPTLSDDDLQKMAEVLPHITTIMKHTFNQMHKVTDDYRKIHNTEMLRKLALEGQGKECQEEDGTKTREFTVSTYGSEETGDLVIFPEKYKLPDSSLDTFKAEGKRGIQKVDQYILSFGVKIGQIGNMPLFQRRLLIYCQLTCDHVKEKMTPEHDSGKNERLFSTDLKEKTENDMNIDTQKSKLCIEKTELSQKSKSKENNLQGSFSNNEESISEARKARMFPMSLNNHIYNDDLDSKIENITDLKSLSDSIKEAHKEHKENLCKILSSGKSRGSRDNTSPSHTENSVNSELEDDQLLLSQTNTINDDNVPSHTDTTDAEIDGNVSTDPFFDIDESSKEEEIEDFDKPKGEYLPELNEFWNILTSIEKQQELSELIPVDAIILPDTEPFTHVEVNEMFNEITTSMISRAAAAKQQRMVRTMKMIKQAARNMAAQVNKVQCQMVKELQIAHRAKQLKAEKQKKQLEETQEMLEHYRRLIAHYQETGQVDKMLEILQYLNELNNLN